MKQLTNYQRTANYLVKVFKMVNEDYFNNKLEMPVISLQSTVSAYGHVSISKIWTNGNEAKRELNLSADYLNRPIENVVATLIHEGCHLYAMQNNIKDTSNQGIYHNKRFKALAEERGLHIERHPRYGWTITEPTEETIDFCIRHELEDIQICRNSFGTLAPISGNKNGNGAEAPKKPRKKSSTRKYICTCCGNSFRATKNINVMCMDCNEQFILAD